MSKTYFVRRQHCPTTARTSSPAPSRAPRAPCPAQDPDQSFKDQPRGLVQARPRARTLKDFSYGAESYDATILSALAAVKGGSNDSATVQKNFAAVSGATDGEECDSYADCVDLLAAGKEIRYTGPSGIGPIDDENDPSSAFVGIYQYDANNKNVLSGTVEGSKPE